LASTPIAPSPRRAAVSSRKARNPLSASQFMTQKYVCSGAEP
jgi:hypothetical protein